jgi:hypothetical protein
MRTLSKAFVIAVGLLVIGVLSSSVSANGVMIGSFTLPHSTQWNNTVLPAGDYTFTVARGQADTHVLSVHGAKQALTILIFAQSACETCRNGALEVAVQDDNRAVTSLDLPGYHLNFKVRQSPAGRGEQLAKTPMPSEQVAVHVSTN